MYCTNSKPLLPNVNVLRRNFSQSQLLYQCKWCSANERRWHNEIQTEQWFVLSERSWSGRNRARCISWLSDPDHRSVVRSWDEWSHCGLGRGKLSKAKATSFRKEKCIDASVHQVFFGLTLKRKMRGTRWTCTRSRGCWDAWRAIHQLV